MRTSLVVVLGCAEMLIALAFLAGAFLSFACVLAAALLSLRR